MEKIQKRLALGRRLRAARRRVKLSVDTVALKLNRTRQAVYAWEAGDALPDLLQLAQLVGLYGTSADAILFDSDAQPARPPLSGLSMLWQVFARPGVPDPTVNRY